MSCRRRSWRTHCWWRSGIDWIERLNTIPTAKSQIRWQSQALYGLQQICHRLVLLYPSMVDVRCRDRCWLGSSRHGCRDQGPEQGARASEPHHPDEDLALNTESLCVVCCLAYLFRVTQQLLGLEVDGGRWVQAEAKARAGLSFGWARGLREARGHDLWWAAEFVQKKLGLPGAFGHSRGSTCDLSTWLHPPLHLAGLECLDFKHITENRLQGNKRIESRIISFLLSDLQRPHLDHVGKVRTLACKVQQIAIEPKSLTAQGLRHPQLFRLLLPSPCTLSPSPGALGRARQAKKCRLRSTRVVQRWQRLEIL